MKRIINTIAQKWPEYLIESIVIVASILGAYALDSWNENRKSDQQEKVFLTNLLADLEFDYGQFEYYEDTYTKIENLHHQLFQLGIKHESIDSMNDLTLLRRSLYFKQLIDQDFLDNSPEIKNVQTRAALIKYIRATSDFEEIYHIELRPIIDNMRKYLSANNMYNASSWFEMNSKFMKNYDFLEMEGRNLIDKKMLLEICETREFHQVLFELNMKWNEFNSRLLQIIKANSELQHTIKTELQNY